MKKTWKSAAPALLYCVPWAFFAPWMDAHQDSMLGYLALILVLGVLDWGMLRMRQPWLGVAGNLVSAGISWLLAKRFLGPEWSYYFKPLEAAQLVVGISAAALLFYLLAVWNECKKQKKIEE